METIIQIIDIIIWPLTILIILYIFRKQFSLVISNLSRIRYKELEANFGKQLRSIENDTPEIFSTSNKEDKNNNDTISVTERLAQIADLSPRAAITEAWIQIEKALFELAEKSGITEFQRRTDYKILQALQKRKVIQEGVYKAYTELKSLRNEAAHNPQFNISPDEAQQYIDYSEDFANYIRAIK